MSFLIVGVIALVGMLSVPGNIAPVEQTQAKHRIEVISINSEYNSVCEQDLDKDGRIAKQVCKPQLVVKE